MGDPVEVAREQVKRDAVAAGPAMAAAGYAAFSLMMAAGRLVGDALTLRGAQAAVDAWIGQFREGYWSPHVNLARLVEEVGELARELNHRHGSKPKKEDEPDQDLALEMADILFVLVALANEQEIDLSEAFLRVLDKYEVRDSGRWTRKS